MKKYALLVFLAMPLAAFAMEREGPQEGSVPGKNLGESGKQDEFSGDETESDDDSPITRKRLRACLKSEFETLKAEFKDKMAPLEEKVERLEKEVRAKKRKKRKYDTFEPNHPFKYFEREAECLDFMREALQERDATWTSEEKKNLSFQARKYKTWRGKFLDAVQAKYKEEYYDD